MLCFLAVFKKDTKEKNQKKAEAKKRKAEQIEQQQQQEPSTDDVADMDQGDPVSAFASKPAQMEAQLSAEQQPVHPHSSDPMQPPSTIHQSAVKLNEHGDDNQQKQSPMDLSDLPMTSPEACQGIVPMQPPPQSTDLAQVPQAAALPHI